jgi:hypothetical protein
MTMSCYYMGLTLWSNLCVCFAIRSKRSAEWPAKPSTPGGHNYTALLEASATQGRTRPVCSMMAASCAHRGTSVVLEVLSRPCKPEQEGVNRPNRPCVWKLWTRSILYILLMHYHVLWFQMLKTIVALLY